MKKEYILLCYNLGLWGIAGFFATILLGFLSCCLGLSKSIFTGSLVVFAIFGLAVSVYCISRGCKKLKD